MIRFRPYKAIVQPFTLLLVALLILTVTQLKGQTGTISGHIIHKSDSASLFGVTVYLNRTELGGVTDMEGNFSIHHVFAGTYDLALDYLGLGQDTLTNILVVEGEETQLELALPFGNCGSISHRCPTNQHEDNIVPIVYGFPSNKMMRQSEKGKVWLGGCELTGCDPSWYCKEHRKEF